MYTTELVTKMLKVAGLDWTKVMQNPGASFKNLGNLFSHRIKNDPESAGNLLGAVINGMTGDQAGVVNGLTTGFKNMYDNTIKDARLYQKYKPSAWNPMNWFGNPASDYVSPTNLKPGTEAYNRDRAMRGIQSMDPKQMEAYKYFSNMYQG